jgi:MFS family permease
MNAFQNHDLVATTSDIEKNSNHDEDGVAEATRMSTSEETADNNRMKTIHNEDKSDSQSISMQTNLLSRKQLLIAMPALSAAVFVSFIDQTSVAIMIPRIAADLDIGASTSWIGGSYLVASTAFQLVNGRLSDLLGRKRCLLFSLCLIASGDLFCGFAKNKSWLFAARAIAGVGGGGVNSIAMIIVSDITTLENRGRYQGILGAMIGLANGTGPFIGGALTDRWRWAFWLMPMIAVPAGVILWLLLPLRYQSGRYAEKIRKIDFGGIILQSTAVLLILVSVVAV